MKVLQLKVAFFLKLYERKLLIEWPLKRPNKKFIAIETLKLFKKFKDS